MRTDEGEVKQTRSCRTARLDDEEDLDEKSRDDDYIPGVARKTNRTRTRTRVRASGSDEPVLKSTKKKGYNRDGSKRAGRILLDDALKSKDSSLDGWSTARKKAFKAINDNPNAYYYRFNKPGESQGKGSWSKVEHKLFMENILKMGVNNNWGLFSKNIPGRVGYQCSCYYRRLVKALKVWDPSYWCDGKKMYFNRNPKWSDNHMRYAFTVLEDNSGVFSKLPAQHPKRPAGLPTLDEILKIAANGFPTDPPDNFKLKGKKAGGSIKSRKRKAPAETTRSRKKATVPTNLNIDDDAYIATKVVVQEAHASDAIPKFIDPVTHSKIKTPAISPYGHVCEYETWTKILRTPGAKNICPFTRKPLTRRQLVKLSPENFEQFHGKIINQDNAIREWNELLAK